MGLSNADHIQIKMIDLPIGALAVNTKRLLMPFRGDRLKENVASTNLDHECASAARGVIQIAADAFSHFFLKSDSRGDALGRSDQVLT
jgi:hypothetical protein